MSALENIPECSTALKQPACFAPPAAFGLLPHKVNYFTLNHFNGLRALPDGCWFHCSSLPMLALYWLMMFSLMTILCPKQASLLIYQSVFPCICWLLLSQIGRTRRVQGYFIRKAEVPDISFLPLSDPCPSYHSPFFSLVNPPPKKPEIFPTMALDPAMDVSQDVSGIAAHITLRPVILQSLPPWYNVEMSLMCHQEVAHSLVSKCYQYIIHKW